MKKKKIMIVGSIVLILLSVIGITMAYLSTGSTQSLANTFTSGCLNINIESESSAITLTNIYPITDIIADFYPAKCTNTNGCTDGNGASITNNTLGLYDVVRNRFFTNAGTGTFVAGPEVN